MTVRITTLTDELVWGETPEHGPQDELEWVVALDAEGLTVSYLRVIAAS